jgi:hypothetical protein
MQFVIDPVGAVFGAKSRHQKTQIQLAQQQLASAETQRLITEDLLAVSCAPVEQRAGILQARIETRRREASARALRKLCGTGLTFAAAVFGVMVLSHHVDSASDSSAAYVPAAAAAPATVTYATPAPVTYTASAPVTYAARAPVTYTAFQDGRADRQAWEAWFAGTSGEFRRGASWWAGQRSLPHPGACTTLGMLGEAAKAGCLVAKAQLDPTDRRRHAEPDYRAGWNSL